MKRIIGYIFIGTGFLFAVSLGGRIGVCIDMIHAVFLGIEDVTVALMGLLITLSLLIISFSFPMCGFLYFKKTFRASFLLSVVCLGFGVIIGGALFVYLASLPRPYHYTAEEIAENAEEDLQTIRRVIENYHQENRKYPLRIDDKIFHTYCYWFKWNNIPDKDNERLIKYLEEELKIRWIKNPKIEKRNNNSIIMVTDNKNVIVFKLNEEADYSIIIELNNKRIDHEYIRRKDDWKVGLSFIPISPIFLPNHPRSNKIVYAKTKPNQKIQLSQITDEGGWIYSPDIGDIRINCSHKDSKGVPYYEW